MLDPISLERKKGLPIQFDPLNGDQGKIAVLLKLPGEIIIDLALKQIIVPHWVNIKELKELIHKIETGVGEF